MVSNISNYLRKTDWAIQLCLHWLSKALEWLAGLFVQCPDFCGKKSWLNEDFHISRTWECHGAVYLLPFEIILIQIVKFAIAS